VELAWQAEKYQLYGRDPHVGKKKRTKQLVKAKLGYTSLGQKNRRKQPPGG